MVSIQAANQDFHGTSHGCESDPSAAGTTRGTKEFIQFGAYRGDRGREALERLSAGETTSDVNNDFVQRERRGEGGFKHMNLEKPKATGAKFEDDEGSNVRSLTPEERAASVNDPIAGHSRVLGGLGDESVDFNFTGSADDPSEVHLSTNAKPVTGSGEPSHDDDDLANNWLNRPSPVDSTLDRPSNPDAGRTGD